MTDASNPAADQTRAMLAEATKDQSDAALTELAHNLGGTDAFLDLVFQGMTQAVDAGRAQDAVVGWQVVDGEQVQSFVLTIAGGKATAERRDTAGSRVTLRLSLPTFIRLVAGHLDGMQAFMSGSIKLEGDIMFAAQLQQMFAV